MPTAIPAYTARTRFRSDITIHHWYTDANTPQVRYRDEQEASRCGQELSVDVFSFSPEIRGRTYWRDTRTLVFEPEQPLYRQAKYHAVLDHARLLPEEKRASAAPVEFEFETLGQQLVTLRGSFLPADPDRPQWVQFHGTLQFAEALTPEMLRRALRLTLDDAPRVHISDRQLPQFSAQIGRARTLPPRTTRSGCIYRWSCPSACRFPCGTSLPPALDAPLTVLAVEEEGRIFQLRITFLTSSKARRITLAT